MHVAGNIAGGIGLFLLGMILMTDGLKRLAGNALRAVLSRYVSSPMSGVLWGTLATAVIQSSSAAILTTIGFVSAGLLTFPQAVGVVFGASLGTTSTGWLVSILGLKVSIGAAAFPLVLAGALLRLLGRDRTASFGLALAGFGLLFVGLGALQQGMTGFAEKFSPADFPRPIGWERVLLVLIGVGMTVVMQSSSAAVATTLTALHSGTVNFAQAASLVIGQSIGTATTSAIAAVGASTPAKRTAVAHVLFNVSAGTLALLVLPAFIRIADFQATRPNPPDAALLLAAFHTTFTFLGLVVLLPMTGPYARLVERLVPRRRPRLAENLDRTVSAVPAVALEASRRTVGRVVALLADTASSMLDPMRARRRSEGLIEAQEALEESSRFLGQIRPTFEGGDAPRHVSVLHALDHAARLLETLEEPRRVMLFGEYENLRDAVAKLREALRTPAVADDGAFADREADRLGEISRGIAEIRKAERIAILNHTATGRVAPVDALERIEDLRWIDRVAYHLWRAVHHLQSQTTGKPESAAETYEDAGAGDLQASPTPT